MSAVIFTIRRIERSRVSRELLHTGISHYRELLNAPWRIVYCVDNRQVLIMAVLDSRRDLQTLLLGRLARS
jgi:plasmid stabilization system protein ParE